jgi:hypothetical protein
MERQPKWGGKRGCSYPEQSEKIESEIRITSVEMALSDYMTVMMELGMLLWLEVLLSTALLADQPDQPPSLTL